MPWIIGVASLGFAGFDAWLKWKADQAGGTDLGRAIVIAALIGGAAYVLVKNR